MRGDMYRPGQTEGCRISAVKEPGKCGGREAVASRSAGVRCNLADFFSLKMIAGFGQIPSKAGGVNCCLHSTKFAPP